MEKRDSTLISFLTALKWVGCGAYLFVSLHTIVALVHRFNHHETIQLTIGRFAGDQSPVPLALSVAILFYFGFEISFFGNHNKRTNNHFISSGVFLFGSAVVMICITIFYLTDGTKLPEGSGLVTIEQEFPVLMLLPTIAATALFTGLGIRYIKKNVGWICVAPVLVIFLLATFYANQLLETLDFCGPVAWPSYSKVSVILGFTTLVAALLAWFEKRLNNTTSHTLDVLMIWLFVLSVAVQYQAINLSACMCTVAGYSFMEICAVLTITAVTAVATGIRYLYHRKQNKSG